MNLHLADFVPDTVVSRGPGHLGVWRAVFVSTLEKVRCHLGHLAAVGCFGMGGQAILGVWRAVLLSTWGSIWDSVGMDLLW